MLARPELCRAGLAPEIPEPGGIRRILHHAPVIIGGAVVPPNFAALTERPLKLVDLMARFTEQGRIAFATSHRLPCDPELSHKFCTLRLRQDGVAHSPEATRNHKVPAIRRYRMSTSKSASFHHGSLNINLNHGFRTHRIHRCVGGRSSRSRRRSIAIIFSSCLADWTSTFATCCSVLSIFATRGSTF